MVGCVFTIGIIAVAIGAALFSGGRSAYPQNHGEEGFGIFLMSVGGIATWFSTTAWAVWAGVQAARRD